MSSLLTGASKLRPFQPQQFGRYTLLLPLSSGGMGEVFLARLDGEGDLRKLCVIKRILPHHVSSREMLERFANETRTLAQLSHGGIAQILDSGVVDGRPYLALEHVDGKDLRRTLVRAEEVNTELPLTFVLYVACRVLDVLSYAHRKRDEEGRELGFVHRDISPQNILVSYEGEVKVIDFGLVKSALNVRETQPSVVLGKLWYMSPEQAQNQRVDFRSDLYSLGMCLYELLCGKNPFAEVPAGMLLESTAHPVIRPLEDVTPRCPTRLALAVKRALEVDPSFRFSSAQEFRRELESVLFQLDADMGPEKVGETLRGLFPEEFAKERRLWAQVRNVETWESEAALGREVSTLTATQVVPLNSMTPTMAAAMSWNVSETTPIEVSKHAAHQTDKDLTAVDLTPVARSWFSRARTWVVLLAMLGLGVAAWLFLESPR